MKKNVILFISLGLVLFINLYFRLFPAYFPRFKAEAANSAESRIYKEIAGVVDRAFPRFSPLVKEQLVRTYIADYKKKNANAIKKEIDSGYKKLKSRFQDKSGQTFLMELDCWNWARYVENVLLLGYPGDRKEHGKSLDMLMLVPTGFRIGWNQFLYYISAFLYKVFCIFKPVPLFAFLFYLPLLFLTIFIVALFLFCYRWGVITAIIACIFVGLCPIFISRSCAGWFDNDILILLLPLLIVWAYLKAGEARHLRGKILWLFLSSFLIGLFCFTWEYWWFIFLIVIIYEVYSLLNAWLIFKLARQDREMQLFRQHLVSLFFFFFFSICWVLLFCGTEPLAAFFSQFKGALLLNKAVIDSIWPNVLSTVAELRKSDFNSFAYQAGGPVLLIMSFFSILALYLRSLRQAHYKGFSAEAIKILVFWFICMFFACLHGVRFEVFLVLPLGICLGWQANDIYGYFAQKKKRLLMLISAVAIIIMINTVSKNAFYTAYNITPMIDDTWYKTLTFIRQATPAQAVINSWWDFGNWFKVIARRRVIFDGYVQDIPQAYWMAHVLVSDNEREALCILRMLNNGGNRAFEIINDNIKDPFKAVILLKKVIASDAQSAKVILHKTFGPKDADELIRIIFSKPPKAYFVVDPRMQSTIPTISFLGNWDFLKVYVTRNLYKESKDKVVAGLVELGVKKEDAQNLYQEAAMVHPADFDGWVSKQLRLYVNLMKGEKKNELVLFDGQIVYNIKDNSVYFFSQRDRINKIPKSLFLLNKGALKEIACLNSDSPVSVLIFKDNDQYEALLLPDELARSLFVRLYFLNGAGLKHFRPFIDAENQEGHIRIFEIIWD